MRAFSKYLNIIINYIFHKNSDIACYPHNSLRAIASKKNFINLHSAAFITVFGRNLVHADKFCIFQKTAQ